MPPNHALKMTAQRNSDTGADSKCKNGQCEISSATETETTAAPYPEIIRISLPKRGLELDMETLQ